MLRLFLAILLVLPALAADLEVKVGSLTMILPTQPELFEVGDNHRTATATQFVPSSHRLLAAYVPQAAKAALSSGSSVGDSDIHALIEILRDKENVECTAKEFEEVEKEFLGPELVRIASADMSKAEDELNLRLKTAVATAIELGKPEMLGVLIQKTDAAAVALLSVSRVGNRTIPLATGLALIRVRDRVLFVILARKYESPETVSWLRKTLETWTDAILAKNR